MKKALSRNHYFVLSILIIAMISCHKQADVNLQNKQDETRFPQTGKEKQTVAVNKEVGAILQEVYQDPKAFYEVCAAIYSGYYEDESVLLKDLLFPETSPLYQSPKFISLRSEKGLFKKEFYATLNRGEYPNLKKAMGLDDLPATGNLRIDAAVPTDTSMEIFSNSNGVSIYFPYSEEFFEPLTTDYFDNINTDPFGYLATVIPADREADSAPGQRPVRRKRIVYNEIEWYIDYFPVTVNDDYAERNTTHIVGVGAEPARINPSDPPPTTNVNRVFVGWGRCNKQYDKLISFNSENGGGSDIKICRISGYLQFQNQQVTNFAGDIGDKHFKRKEIRKGYWKRIYWVWDADWVVGNTEQIMAVYEEDREGTNTFTGSLSTTVMFDSVAIAGAIGYSIVVKTQDELVLQRKISRIAYFGAAKSDQGWGFNLCDKKNGGCRYDNTFLPTGGWPAYDGNNADGANWNYTWPYNSY